MGLCKIQWKEAIYQYQKWYDFFHWKRSSTKFAFCTRKFRKKEAFAIFKSYIWCVDLAYVDEVAKRNRDLMFSLVHQDLQMFEGTAEAKGMKTKDCKDFIRIIVAMIKTKNRLKKFWVEFEGEFWKICKPEVTQI